jgi:hypothetical protein
MWFQQLVYGEVVDPDFVFYAKKAWFCFSNYVNSQNNHHFSAESPHCILEVPLHEVNIGVWHVISVLTD